MMNQDDYIYIKLALKGRDFAFLTEAYRKNGGGVNEDYYSKACVKRLWRYALIDPKPNQFRGNPNQECYLWVLSKHGVNFVKEYLREKSMQDL